MPDRTIAPAIKHAVEFDIKLPPYTYYELQNGAPVYYINDGTEEVAVLDIVFRAGNQFEAKPYVSAAASALIKNGTTTKNAFEINKVFEFHGAFISCRSMHHTASISVHCLTRYLDVLLPVLREIITDAIYPQSELDIFQQNKIQQLAVNLKKCDFVANRLIDEFLYGPQHPYGIAYTKEQIDAVTREELTSFFKTHYAEGPFRIFAAGKLPKTFERLLDTWFGDLPNRSASDKKPMEIDLEREKKHRVTIDPKGVQGAIRIARPFPTRRHPDFLKANILNVLFGGYFGSRLMSNIREDKGYTYGISSYLQSHLESCAWMITTEAGKKVCEATIEEVYTEMRILREVDVEEEELLLVKNYIMGSNLSYIDGPFNAITRWKSLILNNLDEAYFNESIRQIKEITPADIRHLAQKYLNPEEFFELVVI